MNLGLLKIISTSILLVQLSCLFAAKASYKIGGVLGFGGAGITSDQEIQEQTITVSRSDNPIVINFWIEFDLSDSETIALGQLRGVSVAPFSTGVQFNGVTWRWFYPNLVPSFKESSEFSTVMIGGFSPYVGLDLGLAQGTIARRNDLVSEVDASSVYYGLRAGVDRQIESGIVGRFELMSGMTFPTKGLVRNSLTAFSLGYGIYYLF
jgi:hypothetical protein